MSVILPGFVKQGGCLRYYPVESLIRLFNFLVFCVESNASAKFHLVILYFIITCSAFTRNKLRVLCTI